jgi:hypothetical protein
VSPPNQKLTGVALDSFWYSPSRYVSGLSQETCRDLGHVQYGLAALINAAETARIQGVDLFASERERITTALEFNANLINEKGGSGSVCTNGITSPSPLPTWEIALNAYAGVLGASLPNTNTLIAGIRPTSYDHHMAWETLTHAEIGSTGLD